MTLRRVRANLRPRALSTSAAAACVFFAFTAPCGIAAHLISELAGLGWHDDADVAFSARHAYLAVIALLAFASLIVACAAVPRERRRARVAELVDALPFRGRGAKFALFSFAAQFAFFAISQIGEGCPLCSGDVVVGVVAAVIAAALGALAIALCKRRLIALAIELLRYLGFELAAGNLAGTSRRRRRESRHSARRSPFAFRYRPPPFTIRTIG